MTLYPMVDRLGNLVRAGCSLHQIYCDYALCILALEAMDIG